MFYFQAYGLTLRSAVKLPGYHYPDSLDSFDAEINYGEVSPTGLNEPVEQGLFFQIKPEELWLNVPNIARFLIKDGERIIVDPAPDIDEDTLIAFLSGPCLAALLMQRNLFVLHASVLKVNDAAVAYVGEHCTGKSSLIAAMMQQGYLIVSDGLCVVNQEGLVFPGPDYIELWDDSAKTLHVFSTKLQSIRPGFTKYRLPLAAAFYNHPLPLKTVYALHPLKENTARHKYLTGSEKINFLQKNIYNKNYLAGLKKNHLYFDYCARLARQIKMVLVEFNGVAFNIHDLSRCISTLQDA